MRHLLWHGEERSSVSYQEVKSQFGFLEAVNELCLTWGSCSKSQHALFREKVERKTFSLEDPISERFQLVEDTTIMGVGG